MPNAASLIPTAPARPPLAKAEYQAATPDGSTFAGLLDIGTDPPPPPRDPVSPRADDVRDAKRPETSRRDDEPARPENKATDEPQDPSKAPPPPKDSQTSTACKDNAGAETPKTDEKTATDADASTTPDGEGEANAEASVTVAAAETPVPVVTPVTLALLAEQTATDTTPAGDIGAVEAATASTAAARTVADATFTLSVAPEKVAPATPAQSAKAENAVAEAQTAVAAVAQPKQAAQVKQTGPQKADKSGEVNDSGTIAAEPDNTAGKPTESEHVELLKSLHTASEGKERRPEHMADANIDTKTTPDTAPALAVPNVATQQQTPIQAGLAQATTAVNGIHAADPRSASDAATDAAVPVAGLAVEIAMRAREGKNRFEIRLDPPELGRIDVRLDIDGQGNVTSRLLVERADTLDLLRRDFSNLERALNDAGLKTDNGSLQFAMRDQGFAGGGQQQNEFTRSARVIVPGETETIPNAPRYNLTQRSGIDIRV